MDDFLDVSKIISFRCVGSNFVNVIDWKLETHQHLFYLLIFHHSFAGISPDNIDLIANN